MAIAMAMARAGSWEGWLPPGRSLSVSTVSVPVSFPLTRLVLGCWGSLLRGSVFNSGPWGLGFSTKHQEIRMHILSAALEMTLLCCGAEEPESSHLWPPVTSQVTTRAALSLVEWSRGTECILGPGPS